MTYHDEDGDVEREGIDLSELLVMDHEVNAQYLDPTENLEEPNKSDVDLDEENNMRSSLHCITRRLKRNRMHGKT